MIQNQAQRRHSQAQALQVAVNNVFIISYRNKQRCEGSGEDGQLNDTQ